MNVDVACEIRTNAIASFSRNVSITKMHDSLIGLFLDVDEIQKELEQKEQECFLIHVTNEWNASLPNKENYQDLFIEDGGINNEW